MDEQEKPGETPEKKDLPVKESLYDKVPLTVRQLDIIIALLFVALIAFFIIGTLKGNGVL